MTTKKKIVIRVEMADGSSRSKAMALAATAGEVDSVALAGDGKDQVVVVGDVDSIKLTNALRKKFRRADLVEVGEPKKEEEKKPAPEAATVPPPHEWPVYYHPYPYPYPPPANVGYGYGYGYQQQSDPCSIM